MKTLQVVLFLAISFQVAAQKSISLSLTNPPITHALFGENIISTFLNERDFALSPDGKEIYYTISTPKSTLQTIVFCKKLKEGEWTKPEVVSFAGEYSDLEPAFSADGMTIYFSSNRPLNGNKPKDFDIWKVTKSSGGWGKPETLSKLINTEADEFYPSVAKNGNLYFTASYSNGVGKEDIWMSTLSKNEYQTPVALDTAVNSTLYEFNAFVSPNEEYILFSSYGRRDDTGGGDLYISIKNEHGKWQPAKNLKELNSKQIDYCPYVSPDGTILFFTSKRHNLPNSFNETKANYNTIKAFSMGTLNGVGNIYWIEFKHLLTTFK